MCSALWSTAESELFTSGATDSSCFTRALGTLALRMTGNFNDVIPGIPCVAKHHGRRRRWRLKKRHVLVEGDVT